MRQYKVRFGPLAKHLTDNISKTCCPMLCGALCFAAISTLNTTAAESSPPDRSGLTMMLSGGLGYTRVNQGGDESFSSLVLGPLSASVGGFMTPNWALQLRAGTHWFSNEDETDSKRWFSHIYLGSELQHWLRDDVAVSAGIGISVVVTEPIEINADRGLSMSFRGAWAFKTTQRNAFSVALELRPSIFLNNEVILDSLVLLQWQRL